MRNWAQEYKKSKIADDCDDEKKMFKAEARVKAHLKLLASRSRTATSGFAPRIVSVAEDSGPTHSDKRCMGLRQIPTVDPHNRIKTREFFSMWQAWPLESTMPDLPIEDQFKLLTRVA